MCGTPGSQTARPTYVTFYLATRRHSRKPIDQSNLEFAEVNCRNLKSVHPNSSELLEIYYTDGVCTILVADRGVFRKSGLIWSRDQTDHLIMPTVAHTLLQHTHNFTQSTAAKWP
jgi:hypothetical protein